MGYRPAIFTFVRWLSEVQSIIIKHKIIIYLKKIRDCVNKKDHKRYLLPHGVQTSGFTTVFDMKVCDLEDLEELIVKPLMFGLGLQMFSESELELMMSFLGADG